MRAYQGPPLQFLSTPLVSQQHNAVGRSYWRDFYGARRDTSITASRGKTESARQSVGTRQSSAELSGVPRLPRHARLFHRQIIELVSTAELKTDFQQMLVAQQN